MAFNLNKNEPAEKARTPFNLAKGETVVETPKSRNWLMGLLLVLLIGGGLWYYLYPSSVKVSESMAPNRNSVEDAAASEKSLNNALAADNNANPKGSVVNPRDLNITTSEPVKPEEKSAPKLFLKPKVAATFAQGSSALAVGNTLLIKKIVQYLAANPSVSIGVNGYASSDGPLAANKIIAQSRADAFKKYLVEQNVDENRIIASGKGIENPIASNASNAGRIKNRRVEIIFE